MTAWWRVIGVAVLWVRPVTAGVGDGVLAVWERGEREMGLQILEAVQAWEVVEPRVWAAMDGELAEAIDAGGESGATAARVVVDGWGRSGVLGEVETSAWRLVADGDPGERRRGLEVLEGVVMVPEAHRVGLLVDCVGGEDDAVRALAVRLLAWVDLERVDMGERVVGLLGRRGGKADDELFTLLVRCGERAGAHTPDLVRLVGEGVVSGWSAQRAVARVMRFDAETVGRLLAMVEGDDPVARDGALGVAREAMFRDDVDAAVFGEAFLRAATRVLVNAGAPGGASPYPVVSLVSRGGGDVRVVAEELERAGAVGDEAWEAFGAVCYWHAMRQGTPGPLFELLASDRAEVREEAWVGLSQLVGGKGIRFGEHWGAVARLMRSGALSDRRNAFWTWSKGERDPTRPAGQAAVRAALAVERDPELKRWMEGWLRPKASVEARHPDVVVEEGRVGAFLHAGADEAEVLAALGVLEGREVGAGEHLEAVVALCYDGRQAVRMAAGALMSAAGVIDATTVAAAGFLAEGGENEREVVRAVAEDERAIAFLLPMLDDAGETGVRLGALALLEMHGGLEEPALGAVLALGDDPVWEVRERVVEIAASGRGRDAEVDLLLTRATRDEVDDVRRAATYALRERVGREAVAASALRLLRRGGEAVVLLRWTGGADGLSDGESGALLREKDAAVRAAVVRHLRRRAGGVGGFADRLVAMLGRERDGDVVRALTGAISDWGGVLNEAMAAQVLAWHAAGEGRLGATAGMLRGGCEPGVVEGVLARGDLGGVQPREIEMLLVFLGQGR